MRSHAVDQGPVGRLRRVTVSAQNRARGLDGVGGVHRGRDGFVAAVGEPRMVLRRTFPERVLGAAATAVTSLRGATAPTRQRPSSAQIAAGGRGSGAAR